jgi:probable rRNA maturation factor
MAKLRAIAPAALRAVTAQATPGSALHGLDEIQITFVSDDRIAQVHWDFMGDPSPTDVITFQHGELVISADTAAANGRRFDTSLFQELLLYIVHGLLHLAGYTDATPRESRTMDRLQHRILDDILS